MQKTPRWIGLILALLAMACGADTSTSAPRFGDSECAACIADRCRDAMSSCQAESGCAAYLLCLGDCPIAVNGTEEPQCKARCGAALSVSSKPIADALSSCRAEGAGSVCLECGSPMSGPVRDIENQQCLPSTKSDACERCEEERCCQSAAACRNSADCSAVIACVKNCPTGAQEQACAANCYMNHPTGTSLVTIRVICQRLLCSRACPYIKISPCQDCMQRNCLDSMIACARVPECNLLGTCVGLCPIGNQNCIKNCWNKYPAGQSTYHWNSSCGTMLCLSQCGYSQ